MSQTLDINALDADTVALLLGVSTRQVSNYIKQKGLPSHGMGRDRTFVGSEVMEWYVEYKVSTDKYLGNAGSGDGSDGSGTSGGRGNEDLKISERRRNSAMADLKEIELDKVRGTLVPMADVSRVLQAVAKGLQVEVLAFPTRITGPALACRTQQELFTLLTAECAQLCTRLSQLRFDPAAEPVDEEESDDAGTNA